MFWFAIQLVVTSDLYLAHEAVLYDDFIFGDAHGFTFQRHTGENDDLLSDLNDCDRWALIGGDQSQAEVSARLPGRSAMQLQGSVVTDIQNIEFSFCSPVVVKQAQLYPQSSSNDMLEAKLQYRRDSEWVTVSIGFSETITQGDKWNMKNPGSRNSQRWRIHGWRSEGPQRIDGVDLQIEVGLEDDGYMGCVTPDATWSSPYQDVAISAAGAEDCRRGCFINGYEYFGLLCPKNGFSTCKCSNDVGGTPQGRSSCQGTQAGFNHATCTGPWDVDDFLFGTMDILAAYSVNGQACPLGWMPLGSRGHLLPGDGITIVTHTDIKACAQECYQWNPMDTCGAFEYSHSQSECQLNSEADSTTSAQTSITSSATLTCKKAFTWKWKGVGCPRLTTDTGGSFLDVAGKFAAANFGECAAACTTECNVVEMNGCNAEKDCAGNCYVSLQHVALDDLYADCSQSPTNPQHIYYKVYTWCTEGCLTCEEPLKKCLSCSVGYNLIVTALYGIHKCEPTICTKSAPQSVLQNSECFSHEWCACHAAMGVYYDGDLVQPCRFRDQANQEWTYYECSTTTTTGDSTTTTMADWYNIKVFGGTSVGVEFISATVANDIGLYSQGDVSVRQHWVITPGSAVWYHIKVFGGMDAGEGYLSTNSAGTLELQSQDDGSGWQRWVITESSSSWYHIKVFGGTTLGRVYLSARSNGIVDLYSEDDDSGRQKWLIPNFQPAQAYVFGTLGSSICPVGYTNIVLEEDCDAARTELGLNYNGETSNAANDRLPFCWLGADGYANFNVNGDSGSASHVAKLLCKQVGTCKPTISKSKAEMDSWYSHREAIEGDCNWLCRNPDNVQSKWCIYYVWRTISSGATYCEGYACVPEDSYLLGAQGSADCPIGYEVILGNVECQAAAQSIALSFVLGTFANWCPTNRPQGCFSHSTTGSVYNNDRCDGGVDVGDDKRLCYKKASLPLQNECNALSMTEPGTCGQCQGSCQKDEDCCCGLKCFRRDYPSELVPGCASGGEGDQSDYGYCVLVTTLTCRYYTCPAGYVVQNKDSDDFTQANCCQEVWGCTISDGVGCASCVAPALRRSDATCAACNDGYYVSDGTCQAITTTSTLASGLLEFEVTMQITNRDDFLEEPEVETVIQEAVCELLEVDCSWIQNIRIISLRRLALQNFLDSARTESSNSRGLASDFDMTTAGGIKIEFDVVIPPDGGPGQVTATLLMEEFDKKSIEEASEIVTKVVKSGALGSKDYAVAISVKKGTIIQERHTTIAPTSGDEESPVIFFALSVAGGSVCLLMTLTFILWRSRKMRMKRIGAEERRLLSAMAFNESTFFSEEQLLFPPDSISLDAKKHVVTNLAGMLEDTKPIVFVSFASEHWDEDVGGHSLFYAGAVVQALTKHGISCYASLPKAKLDPSPDFLDCGSLPITMCLLVETKEIYSCQNCLHQIYSAKSNGIDITRLQFEQWQKIPKKEDQWANIRYDDDKSLEMREAVRSTLLTTRLVPDFPEHVQTVPGFLESFALDLGRKFKFYEPTMLKSSNSDDDCCPDSPDGLKKNGSGTEDQPRIGSKYGGDIKHAKSPSKSASSKYKSRDQDYTFLGRLSRSLRVSDAITKQKNDKSVKSGHEGDFSTFGHVSTDASAMKRKKETEVHDSPKDKHLRNAASDHSRKERDERKDKKEKKERRERMSDDDASRGIGKVTRSEVISSARSERSVGREKTEKRAKSASDGVKKHESRSSERGGRRDRRAKSASP